MALRATQTTGRIAATLGRVARPFSTDAVVESDYKRGEIGKVSGIPEEHLTRKVIIYSPARTATQQESGKLGKWKINFVSTLKWENPLMGWTSTGDPYANVGDSALGFDSEEAAKSFAERHGWDYVVKKPKTPSSTVQKSRFSSRTRIGSILGRPDGGAGLAGEKVQISGWVKTGREQGKGSFAFLEVNDGSCAANLQVMVDASVSSDISKLVATGTCLTVDGRLKIPPPEGRIRRKQKIELRAENVIDVGTVDPATYPIPKTKLSLEHLRDYTHLRARTFTIGAVTRIRSKISLMIHLFLNELHICHIHTPIITTSDCEGGAEMFQVTTTMIEKLDDYSKDFFGRQAYLTVSGQLHAEAYACSMGDVYTFGPTFRAEKSNTSRHLAEFWMVEVELAFAGLEEAMNCAEALVKHVCNSLLENCYDDMELIMADRLIKLVAASTTPFGRVTYTEAIKLLEEAGKKFEKQVEWGIDLASEHERYLTDVLFQKPVIVYNYPKEIKAFYMRLNDDGKTVAAFDVLVPKVGELIGGSQREERMEVLMERMEEMGVSIKQYEWYIELRRHGTVKHSGFGMGLERMLLFTTGMDNIRDVIPFPRYPGTAHL